jgi:hypothetical protein
VAEEYCWATTKASGRSCSEAAVASVPMCYNLDLNWIPLYIHIYIYIYIYIYTYLAIRTLNSDLGKIKIFS